MKARTFRIICICMVSLIMALIIALDVVCGIFADTITLYLSSTAALDDKLRTEGEALATRIEEEGIVMVKNDEDCLPLDKTDDKKINVLGWSATQWINGGSGSGRVVQYGSITGGSLTPETDLLTAIDDYGIEYNGKIIEMYTRFQSSRPEWSDGSLNLHDYEFCRLYEPSVSDSSYYSDSVKSYTENFSDVAVVVLGRIAGESVDCPKVQYKGKLDRNDPTAVADTERTYLDISTEEEELLAWAGQSFEKVIVIVNSTNVMNLGFLDEIEGLDACLIVGGTGSNAANAIPKVLYGEVSPSGRTADTYVYDFSTAATYVNSGADGVNQYLDDDNTLYPIGITNVNVGDNNEKYTGVSYLDFEEGIYVGYKWYETAYAEKFWESGFAAENFGVHSYDDVVQYPFGYGLGYSSFNWEVVSVTPAANADLINADKITVTVKVTNTGKYKAREVVQLYYCPPYTSGGIEKSAISLAAFAKTRELDCGQSQNVTLSFNVSDMASYDMSGSGQYVLERGDYKIQLMNDAHNINGCNGAVTEYTISSNKYYNYDPLTGGKVNNLFTGEGTDGIAIDGSDSGADIVYLTRADFAGTFPIVKGEAREMSEILKETNLFGEEAALAAFGSGESEPQEVSPTEKLILYDKNGNANSYGLEYGDPSNYGDTEMWDELLDKLSIKEMRNLVLHGYRQEEAIDSIGKPKTTSAYGPAQIGSFYSNDSGVGYPAPSVLAQSWNSALANLYGLTVGKEAGNMKYSGWYAPGANLHRSPFGGRNFENFSEDSFMTGILCSEVVSGAADAGIYCYIKSFIANTQETLRDGLYCWMTEQTLREIYLAPFKTAVANGATGIMTAYNRLGAVWTGGSRALLTDLLRTEWGFKGCIITEYADHQIYMNADQMLYAGGDIWMCNWNNDGLFEYFDKDYDNNPEFIAALRTASKRIIYTGLNAAYTNSLYNATEGNDPIIKDGVKVFMWWSWLLAAINVVAAVSCGAWIYYAIKRKDPPEPEQKTDQPISPA